MSSRRTIRTSLASFLFLAGGFGVCNDLAAQELPQPQTVDILVATGTFAGDELAPDVRIVVTGQAPLYSTPLGNCCGTTELYPVQHALFLQTGQATFFSRFHKLQLIASTRSGISGCSNEPLKAGTRLKDLVLTGLCFSGIYDRYRATIETPPTTSVPDADLDGLSDADEELLGTDPHVADTDGDGLLDGTEFELSIAEGWGTADPLNLDSDGDLLLDGEEVTIYGTSPGKADTDGDLIPDAYDFHPLLPDQVGGYVEEAARALAIEIAAMDPALFTGPNRNVQQGRRNVVASSLQAAANHVKNGQSQQARTLFFSVLDRIDGEAAPEDWMVLSGQSTLLRPQVQLLIALIRPAQQATVEFLVPNGTPVILGPSGSSGVLIGQAGGTYTVGACWTANGATPAQKHPAVFVGNGPARHVDIILLTTENLGNGTRLSSLNPLGSCNGDGTLYDRYSADLN